MPDFYQTPRYQLPDDWEPEGTVCVKVTIPNHPQYYGQLIGLLDTLKWSKNFAPDVTRIGAATVSRTWQAALESAPIEIEGCDMPEFRINPENCLLEVNCSDDPDDPDWQPVPTQGSDPRELPYPVPYPGEPPEGQTNECLAAANAAEWVWIAGGGWAGQLDGGTFAEFTVLVMGVIGGLFTLLTDIIIDHTITLFTEIEPSTIEADWAALDKQDFIDILVCYLNPDGTLPSANWGDFLSALLANTGVNQAWYLVHYIMLLVGWGGINLIARIGGITEADCAACGEWSHEFDFAVSEADWLAYHDAGDDWAYYNAGQGWSNNWPYVNGITIHHTAPGLFTLVRIRFDVIDGFDGTNPRQQVVDVDTETLLVSNFEAGTPVIFDIPANTQQQIRVGFNPSTGGPSMPSNSIITKITIWGTGDNPYEA